MQDDDNSEVGQNDRAYKPGNTDADGNYIVGRDRPPEHGKFRAGDGRKRGRCRKGTKNLATDFHEELASKVTLKVDGKPRRVTKQRAIMMRLMDNASRGQNAAIRTIIEYAEKFGIEVMLEAPDEPPKNEFVHLDQFTELELELFGMLIAKATGAEPFLMDGNERMYDDDNPLAYLENANDPRNHHFDTTIEGVCWKRYTGFVKVPDYIVDIRNEAYNLAAIARPNVLHNCAEEA